MPVPFGVTVGDVVVLSGRVTTTVGVDPGAPATPDESVTLSRNE
jgi:hypothetical protein